MLTLHHVTIVIPRGATDAVVTFYTDVLGLARIPKLASGKSGAWLTVDGFTQVHVSERDEPSHPDSHFALVVDRFDGMLEDLRNAGAPWFDQEDLFGGRRGFTRDPAGNRVEILEAAGALARTGRTP